MSNLYVKKEVENAEIFHEHWKMVILELRLKKISNLEDENVFEIIG